MTRLLAYLASLSGYWGGITVRKLDPRTIKKEH